MNTQILEQVFHKNESFIIREMTGEKSLHQDSINKQNANSDSAKTSNLSEKKVITKTYNELVYEEIPKDFSVTTVSNKDPYA
jgi:hypothetical protein